jgi:hypothetical protein
LLCGVRGEPISKIDGSGHRRRLRPLAQTMCDLVELMRFESLPSVDASC